MSEPWHPTLRDISQCMIDLADQVSTSRGRIDASVFDTLRYTVDDLELLIPGLEPVPDAEAARALGKAAEVALERSDEREALARTLRGLSFAPHDPTLFHLLSQVCFELGTVELAMRMLYHTLWIHPGHHAARADLEALSAFLDGTGDEERAA